MLLSQYRALRKLQERIDSLIATGDNPEELYRIERKLEGMARNNWHYRKIRKFKPPEDNAIDSTGVFLTVPSDRLGDGSLWVSLGYPLAVALVLSGQVESLGEALTCL